MLDGHLDDVFAHVQRAFGNSLAQKIRHLFVLRQGRRITTSERHASSPTVLLGFALNTRALGPELAETLCKRLLLRLSGYGGSTASPTLRTFSRLGMAQ